MYVLVTIKVYFELFELNIEYLFPLSVIFFPNNLIFNFDLNSTIRGISKKNLEPCMFLSRYKAIAII